MIYPKRENSLGKNIITEETIINLIDDDWYFRIKNSHGHSYITKRKGDKEQSLGRYTDELWKTITKIKEKKRLIMDLNPTVASQEMRSHDPINIRLARALSSLQQFRDLQNARTCLFVGDNDFCKYWLLPDIPAVEKMRNDWGDEFCKEVVDADGSKRLAIKANIFTCPGCPTFIDETMVNILKENIKRDKTNR